MSSETLPSVRAYGLVLTALIVLTFATVGVSFISLSAGWHMAIGLSIGVVKATLVALFFMHVLHKPRLASLIVVASLVWLTILISLTLADYFSRNLIPFMPGH